MGDCAVQPEKPLPMIAQAAKQQAIYLGKVLNKDHKKPFRYNNTKYSSKKILLLKKFVKIIYFFQICIYGYDDPTRHLAWSMASSDHWR